MDDAKLIGWLCFWSNQIDRCTEEGRSDTSVWLPHVVRAGWERLGFVTVDDDGKPNWQGATTLVLTEKGKAVIDLHGPEWGFDTIPSESEAGG